MTKFQNSHPVLMIHQLINVSTCQSTATSACTRRVPKKV